MPNSHFVKPNYQRIQRALPQAGASTAPRSLAGARRPAPVAEPDFTAAQTIFELVNPPQLSTAIMDQFQAASPVSRKPMLRHPDGKSSLICFTSSVGAPFNVCNVAGCIRNQTQRCCTRHCRNADAGPPPFCHVDLSSPHWANQPESFWAAVVEWLRLPGVSAVIRPSQCAPRCLPLRGRAHGRPRVRRRPFPSCP